MRKLILLSLLIASTSYAEVCSVCHADEFNPAKEMVSHAKEYLYVREKTNNNDAPEIDFWLKRTGVGKGESYCQAFFVNMYKDVYDKHNLKSPWPMYAGVARVAEFATKNPLKFKVISTKKMLWNVDTPMEGDLASWKHGKAQFTGFGYKGHAEVVKAPNIKTQEVYTIGANTKPGAGGDQSGAVKGDLRYGHEGVYERTRSINIYSTFPIVYFIRGR